MSHPAVVTRWYDPYDGLPPASVAVVVWWVTSRPPFEAARVPHPRSRRLTWLTHDHGRPVFLPVYDAPADPRRPWAGWHTLSGEHPALWRPKNERAWTLPLPPPARVDDGTAREGRMWSASQDYRAVDAAEAALLSQEMEDDREHARRNPGVDAAQPVERQWWRDPSAVVYATAGSVTRRDAEGRVMRALLAETAIRVERPGCATFAGILARLSATLPLAPGELAAMDLPPERVVPTGRDHDDLLTALGWLAAVHETAMERPRRAIRLRALDPPLGWREIGRRLGCSHEAARTAYATGVDAVWSAANGWPTSGTRATAARLDAVRAANSAHRKA
jgi:hypothetical protein